MVPGMMFTIEPMINQGGYELYIDQDNEWTSYTEDGLSLIHIFYIFIYKICICFYIIYI